MKALCEEYDADISAIDFRGQTPLHVATSSGELGSLLYIDSLLTEEKLQLKEAKDNALMTPLMNSVAINSIASFVHLFFEDKCSLNTVDIHGNTILHLAAKGNAISVVKILKHIYQDAQKQTSPLYQQLMETKLKQQVEGDESGINSDHMLFFELNRTNLSGQSPIFLTV